MKNGKMSGYPLEHLRDRRRFILGFLLFLSICGSVATFFAYNAVYSNAPLMLASNTTGIFLLLLWIFYASVKSPSYLAIYFEKKVVGDAIWSKALLRNCLYLDELCIQSKVLTLSSFGFTDDWSGKNMIWHPPEKGLQTVTTLLHQLHNAPDIMGESSAIIADLQKMEERLRETQQNQTRFCFIIHGDGWNSMEMEQRCGYF